MERLVGFHVRDLSTPQADITDLSISASPPWNASLIPEALPALEVAEDAVMS